MQLFYKKYGEAGPPLLILHGMLGAGGNWHTLANRSFSAHYTVYAIDQRNHGRSPHDDRMDYDVMASDIDEFVRQHELGPVHLMGHSMGGKTAMRFALDYPDQVCKLIVVDMSPRSYEASNEVYIDAIRSIPPEEYASRQEVEARLAEKVSSLAIRQFLLKNLSLDPSSKQYSWQLNIEAIHRNYDRLNEAITSDRPFVGPALFVHGGRSKYVRPEDQAEIKRLFPRAEIVAVPDAGHWVHADAPDELARIVIDFLGE